jgi:small GTP-binding protein
MLRIGPLVLSSSRRQAFVSAPAALSATVPSNTSLLPRSTPTTASRFLSSSNADADGDAAVQPRPARSSVSVLRRPNNDKEASFSNEEESVDRVQELFRQRASRGGEVQNQRPQHRSKQTMRHSNDNGNGNNNNNNNNRWEDKRQSYGNNNNRTGGFHQKLDNSRRHPHQQQQQGNHRGRNDRTNDKAPEDSQTRLRSLMEDLKRSASKPVGHPPSTPPSSEKLPHIPSLKQRFLRTDGGAPNSEALPPLNMDRQFRIRPPKNQNAAGSFGSEATTTMTRSASSPTNPAYRMPRRQQEAQRNGNNYNSQNNHRQQPVFRDSMEFLEGRRVREEETAPSDDKKNDTVEEISRTVKLPGGGVGLDLTQASSLFRIKVDDIQKKLKSMGFSSEDLNVKGMTLDTDTLELLAMEYGIETVRGEDGIVVDTEELLMQQRRADDAVTFPSRPPVVTIMGHVDHGKTTLLDALRRRSAEQQNPTLKNKTGKKKKDTNSSTTTGVAGTEAGGITQIVTAFQVDVEGQDNKVTFLDTPGHAAFKSMRQSGSHAADVIVLVIAADDGVSEQTIEILNFYKSIVKGSSGGISMVVALNKIDKPGIEVEEARTRIENQLLEQGIICEGMKGDSEFGPPVQVIPTSGLTGLGLDDLMDGLLLQSEIMDLRADYEALAEGIVMDARIEKGLGVVADCIVRWGCIEKGDFIVSGSQASRVRMLKDGKWNRELDAVVMVVGQCTLTLSLSRHF